VYTTNFAPSTASPPTFDATRRRPGGSGHQCRWVPSPLPGRPHGAGSRRHAPRVLPKHQRRSADLADWERAAPVRTWRTPSRPC